MKVPIGMLIWKEMKNQGLSKTKFVELLREQNVIIKDIFGISKIDAYALIQISIVLKVNFFTFYEYEELTGLLKTDENLVNKTTSFKAIINEQDKLLHSYKKLISQQDSLIAQLKSEFFDK